MRTVDVAIIGGGVVGCSVAFHLTRAGVSRVSLFERKSLASGATGICPGGIRQQFANEAECRFARHSVRFFDAINAILEPDTPFHFERSGYLFLAESQRAIEDLGERVAMQNRLSVPSRFVGPDEIGSMLPHLHLDGVLGGSFCAEDGFLEDCHGVTMGLARRARDKGARIVYEEVKQLRIVGSSVQIWTTRDTCQASAVVLAAGADSVDLASQLGITLPMVAEPRRLLYTAPHAVSVLPSLVVAPERAFGGKQLSNGVFYLGWLAETPADDNLTFVERTLAAGSTLLPLLADVPVRRTVAGTYDTTPDRRPIVGAVPGFERVHMAAGFSGHGFMLAPAIGEVVAAGITGRAIDLPVDAFSIGRFSSPISTETLSI